MNDHLMIEKLATLWPEMVLGIGAAVCLVIGLTPSATLRRKVWWVSAVALIAAACLVVFLPQAAGGAQLGILPVSFVKLAVIVVGLLLLMVVSSVPDRLKMTRQAESEAAGGGKFEPGDMMRGEFFAFFLLSLMGAMLCAGANDLVWLFLALELTSLPTYVMVATSHDRIDAQEAAVKYFFLGAMAAAVFLYGFSLIYGVTGTTLFYTSDPQVASIAGTISELRAGGESLPGLLVAGLLLALVGIAFKIAAVPMHFYAADVYQGTATPVTAFLAFVPKTAGFVSIILLLSLIGWPLPGPVMWLLWIMAALTMTIGNVMGLLQSNVKRVLAYSSIAHSGYMLVGLVAGPAIVGGTGEQVIGDGIAAVLFYLVAYGLATLGAFAVLSCLRVGDREAQTYDDLAGLATRPRGRGLAAIMLISVLSLVGLPPMVGFLGKIYLFGSAINNSVGHPELIWLVVIAVLNSAVSAVYYLRIIGACYFSASRSADEAAVADPSIRPAHVGAVIAAVMALILGLSGSWLVSAAHDRGDRGSRGQVVAQPLAAPRYQAHLEKE